MFKRWIEKFGRVKLVEPGQIFCGSRQVQSHFPSKIQNIPCVGNHTDIIVSHYPHIPQPPNRCYILKYLLLVARNSRYRITINRKDTTHTTEWEVTEMLTFSLNNQGHISAVRVDEKIEWHNVIKSEQYVCVSFHQIDDSETTERRGEEREGKR